MYTEYFNICFTGLSCELGLYVNWGPNFAKHSTSSDLTLAIGFKNKVDPAAVDSAGRPQPLGCKKDLWQVHFDESLLRFKIYIKRRCIGTYQPTQRNLFGIVWIWHLTGWFCRPWSSFQCTSEHCLGDLPFGGLSNCPSGTGGVLLWFRPPFNCLNVSSGLWWLRVASSWFDFSVCTLSVPETLRRNPLAGMPPRPWTSKSERGLSELGSLRSSGFRGWRTRNVNMFLKCFLELMQSSVARFSACKASVNTVLVYFGSLVQMLARSDLKKSGRHFCMYFL